MILVYINVFKINESNILGSFFVFLQSKKAISVAPWGANVGGPWDDGIYASIRQIILVHPAAIDSIKIEYDIDGHRFH